MIRLEDLPKPPVGWVWDVYSSSRCDLYRLSKVFGRRWDGCVFQSLQGPGWVWGKFELHGVEKTPEDAARLLLEARCPRD